MCRTDRAPGVLLNSPAEVRDESHVTGDGRRHLDAQNVGGSGSDGVALPASDRDCHSLEGEPVRIAHGHPDVALKGWSGCGESHGYFHLAPQPVYRQRRLRLGKSETSPTQPRFSGLRGRVPVVTKMVGSGPRRKRMGQERLGGDAAISTCKPLAAIRETGARRSSQVARPKWLRAKGGAATDGG